MSLPNRHVEPTHIDENFAKGAIIEITNAKTFNDFFIRLLWMEREVRLGHLKICAEAENRCIIGPQVDNLVRLDVELLLAPVTSAPMPLQNKK